MAFHELIKISIVMANKYNNITYLHVYRSMKIRKKMSGGNADDMRIGDILCENVSNEIIYFCVTS